MPTGVIIGIDIIGGTVAAGIARTTEGRTACRTGIANEIQSQAGAPPIGLFGTATCRKFPNVHVVRATPVGEARRSHSPADVAGWLVPNDPSMTGWAEQIAALAVRHAIPTMFGNRVYAVAGGLSFTQLR